MKKTISAVLALLAALTILSTGVFAKTYSVPSTQSPTIDGVVSSSEYGAPILSGVGKDAAVNGSIDEILTYWNFDPDYAGTESFDLYMNNDRSNIYLGVVVHDTEIDAKSKGRDLWKYANFAFTIAAKNDETTIPRIEYQGDQYEQFTGYRLAMLRDGTTQRSFLTLGIDPVTLTEGQDYAIRYDESARTMTYEIVVPYSTTNIKLSEGNTVMFSMMVALPYSTNGQSARTNGGSRFLLGTAVAFCGGANNFVHPGQCVEIRLNDQDSVGVVEIGDDPSVDFTTAPDITQISQNTTGQTEEIALEHPFWFGESTQRLIILLASVLIALCAIVLALTLVLKKHPEWKEKLCPKKKEEPIAAPQEEE